MPAVQAYLLVAAGSALGGMARFWTSGFVHRFAGMTFPWGTLSINVLGGLVIGFFGAMVQPDGGPWAGRAEIRPFFMIGICGGFTTFSSFSLEMLNMLRAGNPSRAALYAVASVALCLISVWLGFLAGASQGLVSRR